MACWDKGSRDPGVPSSGQGQLPRTCSGPPVVHLLEQKSARKFLYNRVPPVTWGLGTAHTNSRWRTCVTHSLCVHRTRDTPARRPTPTAVSRLCRPSTSSTYSSSRRPRPCAAARGAGGARRCPCDRGPLAGAGRAIPGQGTHADSTSSLKKIPFI